MGNSMKKGSELKPEDIFFLNSEGLYFTNSKLIVIVKMYKMLNLNSLYRT